MMDSYHASFSGTKDSLCYLFKHTDNTVIFMEYDLEEALNMKIILCIFKQLLGLKIYFDKRVRSFSLAKPKRTNPTNSYYEGNHALCPFEYLGIPH
jgi:hypothetical protein